MKKLLIYFVLSFFNPLMAQSEHKHSEGQHISMLEVFQGNGDEQIVCYKQKHRNFFFITFVMVVGLGVVIYSRFRIKKKLFAELELKTKLLEEKQKEILDSIRYASRIQQSLLTPEKYINRKLDDLKK